MSIDVEAPLHWHVLDLRRTRQQHVSALVEAFPQRGRREAVTRRVAGAVADIAVQVAGPGRIDLMDEPPDDVAADVEVLSLAAWVLLEDLTILSPQAMAVLRVQRRGFFDPFDVLAEFCRGAELDSEPTMEALTTPSGPAHFLQVRTIDEVNGAREVQEQFLVVWLRPSESHVLTLSCATADLLLTDRVGHALRLLAEGVSGA